MIDIVTSALAVFETSVSEALSNSKIDERRFDMLQTLYHESLNELTGFNHKMEAEKIKHFQKSPLEEIENTLRTSQSFVICSCFLCATFACYLT